MPYDLPFHSHDSSEAHGLTSGQITRRFPTTRALLKYCAWIIIAVCVLQNAGFLRTLADDTPLEEKARLRRAWTREKNNHQLDVVQWGKERADHRAEIDQWDHDRTAWRKEVAKAIQDEKRRSREAAEEFERVQQDWRRQSEAEKIEEERKREVLREAFRREREQEEKERQEARDTFNREMEAEESRRQAQREGWARERMEEERHRKDIERRRQGVRWSEPRSNPGCSAYGTKTYVADLLDIPGDLNWQDVCYDMPITINGRRVDRPAAGDCHRNVSRILSAFYLSCAEWHPVLLQGWGNVWATWSIDFHEEQCVLYWDEIRDMVRCSIAKPCLLSVTQTSARVVLQGSLE